MASEMTVRPATAADVDAIVALVQSSYRGDASRAGWTTEADLLDGQRTDADEVGPLIQHTLVGELAREIVASCVLRPEGDHAHFGMFAVQPGRQGTGIGSVLMSAAESRARELGLHRVEMTVLTLRPELIAFYERRGYVATGQVLPFPTGARFGIPRRDDLQLGVYAKRL